MTGYRRKLTDAQIEDVIAKRERGWSYRRLAGANGVSAGAIHYQCLKHGAVSPRQRRRPVPTEPSSFVARDGRTQRKFTQAEDARLLELESQGLNHRQIAGALGRAITSVRIRLMTLAIHEDIPCTEPTDG